ncbi:MAG: glycosyltransferase involved in cell wall biosynthesis [Colwellia sp.]|jgi:glycosyltransferase involved in cell wall biosynthesis
MIDVLLATYNGELFLKEQIDSILNQEMVEVRLLVRDDGSTDSTLDILNQYSDERLSIITDGLGNLGVAENFRVLMKNSTSEYIFFSDQDDIWLPNKVITLIEEISKHNQDEPLLSYSFGNVVDKNLNQINDFITIESHIKTMSDILFINGGIQGCAMAINKQLLDLYLSNNIKPYMHDQLITLLAIGFGQISFVNKPLFLYRQHDNNVIGNKKRTLTDRFFNFLKDRSEVYLLRDDSVDTIKKFNTLYNGKLSDYDLSVIKKFIYLADNDVNIFIIAFYAFYYKFNVRGSKFNLIFKAFFCKYKK